MNNEIKWMLNQIRFFRFSVLKPKLNKSASPKDPRNSTQFFEAFDPFEAFDRFNTFDTVAP